MARSITGLLGLAGTVVFAVPVALLGLDYLVSGDPLGLAFLAIAAGMVLAEEYLFRPSDVPAAILQRVAGAVAEPPEDEEE
ncbi:hypothetical protein BRC81_16795 [Halobacteriales archaeon QS_1_68_20]|nr:MAG: hypothetical protein BRC81_16795 [Halobacteriales archaeon QS_1_68_20]